jgi:hypothetical protein
MKVMRMPRPTAISGTISGVSKKNSIKLLPRKLSRAITRAAGRLTATHTSVTISAMTTVLAVDSSTLEMGEKT